jgi:hypothetical protein
MFVVLRFYWSKWLENFKKALLKDSILILVEFLGKSQLRR